MKTKTFYKFIMVLIFILWLIPTCCKSQNFVIKPIINEKILKTDTLKVNGIKTVIYTLKDGYWVCNRNGVEYLSPEFFKKWKRKNKIKN